MQTPTKLNTINPVKQLICLLHNLDQSGSISDELLCELFNATIQLNVAQIEEEVPHVNPYKALKNRFNQYLKEIECLDGGAFG